MNTEVFIYLQKVKEYMKKNDEARESLMIDKDEEKFYDLLTKFSLNNLTKTGFPELSHQQFVMISTLVNNPNTEIVFDDDIELGEEGDSYIFLLDNENETIKYGKL